MKLAKFHKRLSLLIAPLAFGVLSACGGGGTGDTYVADGGIRGTGSSVGPVSGFGSVFVNGVKFETDGVVVSDDGIDREGQLKEGMILRIEGEWSQDGQGKADLVEYDDTFRGVVSDVQEILAPDGEVERVTFKIYGQSITADRQTVLNKTTLTDLTSLPAGTLVRVSGWRQTDGSYRASYLGVISGDTSDIEIEGRVEQGSLNTSLNEFTIEGQKISYSDSSFRNGLTEADLQDLLLVEAEGEMVGGVLNAEELSLGDTRRYLPASGTDTEFTGPVEHGYSAASGTFGINGLTVRVDGNTEFDDGLTKADLIEGLLIQVEGEFQQDGSVLAEEIEVREGEASVEGLIDTNSINFSNETFRVGGVLVQVTSNTIIVDDDSDQRIGLSGLNGIFKLEVDGIEKSGPDGVFIEAIKIEREAGDQADQEYELTGRLTHLDCHGTLRVLDVAMTFVGADAFDDDCAELKSLVDSGASPLIEVEYSKETSPEGYVAEEIEQEDD
ncbi:DUF5666 domain-containing protein [Marinobacter sp.]|uniref:DUF5666 domain-containing protein n=1 Tax=Marinobacter sp. TaxID=50741 RepID=UPI003567281F